MTPSPTDDGASRRDAMGEGGPTSQEKTTTDVLLDRLCTQIYRIQLVFLIALFFFLFSVVALFVLERGTATYVVNVLNVAGLSVFVAVFGTLTYLCNNREPI